MFVLENISSLAHHRLLPVHCVDGLIKHEVDGSVDQIFGTISPDPAECEPCDLSAAQQLSREDLREFWDFRTHLVGRLNGVCVSDRVIRISGSKAVRLGNQG